MDYPSYRRTNHTIHVHMLVYQRHNAFVVKHRTFYEMGFRYPYCACHVKRLIWTASCENQTLVYISMRAKQFCVLTTTESGAKIWRQLNALSPPPPPPWLRLSSVLWLLIYCLMYFPSFVAVMCLSLFCYALLCVHPSFAIILKRHRKLVALLLLSYKCIVTIHVLWLFLAVPWVGLQCGIHTRFQQRIKSL